MNMSKLITLILISLSLTACGKIKTDIDNEINKVKDSFKIELMETIDCTWREDNGATITYHTARWSTGRDDVSCNVSNWPGMIAYDCPPDTDVINVTVLYRTSPFLHEASFTYNDQDCVKKFY